MKKTAFCAIVVVLLAAPAAWAKLGGGDIHFSVKGASDVVYSHDFHVGKAGVKCTECHYQIYNTKSPRKTITMADMRNGRSCGACHDGNRAFDVRKACFRCHK